MSERIFQELVAPDDSQTATTAIETLRAWVIDSHLQCSLNPSVFSDHAEWGVLLADLARHIATGLHQTHGVDGDETLKTILTRFEDELFGPDGDAA